MFGTRKRPNENWTVTIRRGKHKVAYLKSLLYEEWGCPKKVSSEYNDKNNEIIISADNIKGIDIREAECGYEIILTQILRDNQIDRTRAIEYRAYLRRGKLIIRLSEPVRDVTVYKPKRKAAETILSQVKLQKAMTKSEIIQEILSM